MKGCRTPDEGYQLAEKVFGKRISELEAENAELREKLRWRKWPEERPTDTQRQYTVRTEWDGFYTFFWRLCDNDGWSQVTYWRPIDGPEE